MATAPDDTMETQTEPFSPPCCWKVAEIDVFWRNANTLWSIGNISAPLFQFMVQKQQNVLKGIVEECGFDFDPENSKLRLTVRNESFKETELEEKINTLLEGISTECKRSYKFLTFQIDENVWPCIWEKFFWKSEKAFQNGLIQVYKRSENTYCLVGIASIFEEQSSILGDLNEQHESIKIENMKLFVDLAEVLKLGCKTIEMSAKKGFLILCGQKEEVRKCAQFCKTMLNTEKMSSCTRVVSPCLYQFLKSENVKPAINSALQSNGHCVDWEVTREKTYNFVCWSISDDPERAADFVINQLVKEISFAEQYLKYGPVYKHLKDMENGKLFEPSQGFSTLLYYGSIYLPTGIVENEKFWFWKRVYRPEVLRFLCRPGVQEYSNTKLRFSSKMWGIFPQDQRVGVVCQNIAQVEVLVSQIVDQVYIVSKSAKICQNHHLITQFCQNHPDLVEIKEEKDCLTFYLIADFKDEFENLFEGQTRIGKQQGASLEESLQSGTKIVSLLFTVEVLEYLQRRCRAALNDIKEITGVDILINDTACSLEIIAKSETELEEAKKRLIELLHTISCQREKIIIRQDFDLAMLNKLTTVLEEDPKHPCNLTILKNVEEPKYFACWDAQYLRIVTVEGSLASFESELLICFLDEKLQPLGSSAKQILMTVELPELEKSAKTSSKFMQKNSKSKCNFISSSKTGILKCRKVLFVSSKNLEGDMGEIWDEIIKDVDDNKWCTICFPVDSKQITSKCLNALFSILAKDVSTTLSHTCLEIQFCMLEPDECLKASLHGICKRYLEETYIEIDLQIHGYDHSHEPEKEGLPFPVAVKLIKGQFLDVANELKVDVIVNSTNTKLNLENGYVSSLICRKGGQELKDELKANFQKGIGYGELALNSQKSLGFQKIFHGALYDRSISRKLALKLQILKCFVTRCLLEMKKNGYKTIAFPALGTGKLNYPYISVARAIKESVTEFGRKHPKTCLETVYIILHETETECIQIFEDVFKCPVTTARMGIGDIFLKPEITFWECRVSAGGTLIQLLLEEGDEPVDAVVKFSSRENTGGGVNLKWNNQMECYTIMMTISSDTKWISDIVQQCFRMFDAKRISSARIDIEDLHSGSCKDVLESFTKHLNENLISSRNANSSTSRKSKCCQLKKLQFLICEKDHKKILHKWDPSATSSKSGILQQIFGVNKKDPSVKWREVTMKQQRDAMVSVLGSSTETVNKVLSEFKENAALGTTEMGNWCYEDRQHWKFVSRITSAQLNKAVLEGFPSISLKEEDGTDYIYNFIKMERSSSNQGDVLPNEIRCLSDYEELTTSEKECWYVCHRNKWVLLPEGTRLKLSKAKKSQTTFHDAQYSYDVINMERKQIGNKVAVEELMVIEVPNTGATKSESIRQKKKQPVHVEPYQLDKEESQRKDKTAVSVFDIVSGMVGVSGEEMTGKEVLKIASDAGSKPNEISPNLVRIEGSLSQIKEINKKLKKRDRQNSEDSETVMIIKKTMSEQEYDSLCFFGAKLKWFKKKSNEMCYKDGSCCVGMSKEEGQTFEKDLQELVQNIQMMASETVLIQNENIDVANAIKQVNEKHPNVYICREGDTIRLISENYEELLETKTLLQQKLFGKVSRRVGRTFAKTGDPSETLEKSDGYKFAQTVLPDSKSPSFQSPAVEVKKGRITIKIYAGSITKLNVDCIVNAANEQLMHGGGVAAAISDAAGYQFNQESNQYIADNGPLQVGSCCVTSAGKLPYRCVIHTVGPRWNDYRDSNICLELLKQSVEVAFETADLEGMNSVAIPAISSGIFGVPRDKCVEQYYKAAMSFCSTYPCKSLREIHFVDRDESMVRAIQTVFESKEPIKTSNEIKNTESAYGNDESSILNKKEEMPPTENSYTIVTVSDSLQIKLHLGSITDIVADVIVCPQEKFCTSNNQIARDIFRKDPGSKPNPGKREIGDIFSRIPAETSPWKEIIHAVFPIYNEEFSKDPTNFGKTFNAMLQEIFRKADNGKFTAIAVPFFIKDKDGYKAPVYWCALDFLTAVTSKGKTLKDIYIVVQNEDDEKTFLDACKANRYEITPRSLIQPKRLGTDQDFGKTLTKKPDKEDNCCICMDTPTNPKRLKCGHIYCKECIEQQFAYKPACPSCGQIYGKMTGDQPPGTISIRKDRQTLQGVFDSKGCIILTYSFSSGYQGEENPHPGQWYKGIQRSGYVPNNERGRLVAKLLNVAFSRRLVFTIGRSRTTGEDGVITWNDIHHKTRHYGGSEKFGYPDPTYLDRVLEELAAKGVTPESADDAQEYTEYSRAMRY